MFILFIKGLLKILLLVCIWGIPMIVAIIIYKRKAKGEINYWKSFIVALIVFSIISIIGITGAKIMRFMDDGYVVPFSHLILVSLRMLGIGIVSSLIVALFFKNKIMATGAVVLAIVAYFVYGEMNKKELECRCLSSNASDSSDCVLKITKDSVLCVVKQCSKCEIMEKDK